MLKIVLKTAGDRSNLKPIFFIPHMNKYTAPDLKSLAKAKFKIDRKPYPRKPYNVDVPRMEVEIMHKKNKELQEVRNDEDLFTFDPKVTTLESQMASLKTKGFLRAYKSYTPPADVERQFTACISSVLGENISDVSSIENRKIKDREQKLKVLNALSQQFCHRVHNSRIHLMKTFGDLYTYFTSPVVTSTPYEQLHDQMLEGSLPDNLVIQLDAIRFTGEGDHPLNTVTAFPRRNTVLTNIETVDKLVVAKKKPSPYQEEDYN